MRVKALGISTLTPVVSTDISTVVDESPLVLVTTVLRLVEYKPEVLLVTAAAMTVPGTAMMAARIGTDNMLLTASRVLKMKSERCNVCY